MKAMPRIEGEVQCWEHNCEVYVKASDYELMAEHSALIEMARDTLLDEVKRLHDDRVEREREARALQDLIEQCKPHIVGNRGEWSRMVLDGKLGPVGEEFALGRIREATALLERIEAVTRASGPRGDSRDE